MGGATGTLFRFALGEAMPMLLATLLVNLLGSLLLGLLAGLVRDGTHPARRLLGTGVLGGFTTYSTVAVVAARSVAAPWVAMNVAGGVVLAVVGLWLGRRLRPGSVGVAR